LGIVVLGLGACSKQVPPLPPAVTDSKPAATSVDPENVTPAKPAEEPEDQATVSGFAAIGFFPPITEAQKENDDGGLTEGFAHLEFALDDVAKCLAPKNVDLVIKITRSLTVTNGSATHKFDFPQDWAEAIGIVLSRPGKEPVVVYATTGPSSLIETAPQAAWKYFSEPNCKRYEE
jgi:hypothetical protein